MDNLTEEYILGEKFIEEVEKTVNDIQDSLSHSDLDDNQKENLIELLMYIKFNFELFKKLKNKSLKGYVAQLLLIASAGYSEIQRVHKIISDYYEFLNGLNNLQEEFIFSNIKMKQ